jgi:hypothetical protein
MRELSHHILRMRVECHSATRRPTDEQSKTAGMKLEHARRLAGRRNRSAKARHELVRTTAISRQSRALPRPWLLPVHGSYKAACVAAAHVELTVLEGAIVCEARDAA